MKRKVTIYTLAEELNVSPSAVSRAFNPGTRLSPEKRARILEAAARYDFTPNRAASRLSSREIRIGALIVGRIPEFSRFMCEGILAGERELATQKVRADLRMFMHNQVDTEALLRTMNEFRAEGCDGVIVCGIYGSVLTDVIGEFADAGIPVVTLLNDLPESRRLFNFTSNTAMSGAIAAELLNAFLHGPSRKVAIITGNMDNLIHQRLAGAFIDACARENLEFTRLYDAKDEPARARRCAEELFAEHPDLDGLYINSANSVSVCEYLEEQNLAGKVTVIASDTFPRLNDYIRSGVVSASIYQDPFRQARGAFVNLYRHLAENADVPEVLMANPQVVLRSNLSLFE